MRFPAAAAACVAAALTFAGLPAPHARAAAEEDAGKKEYEIKLVRPPKVGQRYTFTADGALTRTIQFTVAGQGGKPNEDGLGIHLEGTVEVLAVNKDGEEGKVACTVTKCTLLKPDGEQELVPAGRVITATGGTDETTFTLDQGKLPEGADEALDLVLRMGEEDGFNDDKIYGTAKRQPVGGSWPIDAKAAVNEAKGDGVEFEAKDITGTLTLEKVETVDGVECMRIGGVTEIKRFTSKAPEGMTFDTGWLKAQYGGVYPLDQKLGTLAERMSVTHSSSFRGTNDGGQATRIESKVQRAVEMKRKFLPDAAAAGDAAKKDDTKKE